MYFKVEFIKSQIHVITEYDISVTVFRFEFICARQHPAFLVCACDKHI